MGGKLGCSAVDLWLGSSQNVRMATILAISITHLPHMVGIATV